MATITKTDDEQRLVFGWGNVAILEDGATVVDKQEDFWDSIDELEDTAYDYVLHSRDGGDTHLRKGVATMVESFVSTPEKLAAIGLPPDALPQGWWVGFKVHDDKVWKGVKADRYTGFSIGGSGQREKGHMPVGKIAKAAKPMDPLVAALKVAQIRKHLPGRHNQKSHGGGLAVEGTQFDRAFSQALQAGKALRFNAYVSGDLGKEVVGTPVKYSETPSSSRYELSGGTTVEFDKFGHFKSLTSPQFDRQLTSRRDGIDGARMQGGLDPMSPWKDPNAGRPMYEATDENGEKFMTYAPPKPSRDPKGSSRKSTVNVNATATRKFDAMMSHDDWQGYGYLGERDNAKTDTDPGSRIPAERIDNTDRKLVEYAAIHGVSDDTLFEWANSKSGRWFADMSFGDPNKNLADVFADAEKQGLLPGQSPNKPKVKGKIPTQVKRDQTLISQLAGVRPTGGHGLTAKQKSDLAAAKKRMAAWNDAQKREATARILNKGSDPLLDALREARR